ncbi:MAG: dihydroorotate dehydrogenase B catalytic subunit [Acidobacteria bacterium RIFCSPLOWO2_02_FULL_59_13]|nr:MAG: dihydroorotate dehydrogenase B catalytic subunit [Acidobacteria bacterium RIFCSPLOWO2_02_FULL_59_13]
MAVEFAGLRLNNPIIAASGTFGYGLEFAPLLDLEKLGGLVVKGLSRLPMAGNPPPRLVETPAGLLNSIGLQNIGVAAFVQKKLPLLAQVRTAVIANVFGYQTEDYVEVVRQLESAPGLAAYELNLSCPNTRHGGIVFGSDPVLTKQVTEAVRKICRRPLIVKLSPNVTDIATFAQAAEAGGADAVSLVNTFVGMQLGRGPDQATLPGGTGGLSGPAIRNVALRLVHQAVRAVRIPVIGMGGIVCGADAAEFLRAGAVAVEVGTASFYDPLATVRIVGELESFCRRAGIGSIADLSPLHPHGGGQG